MRFVLGLAEAGFFPGDIYYLTLWYPSRPRSTRTAWFVSAMPLAGVIGNPISGGIMDLLSGALGLAGWQWLFLTEGLPSILVGSGCCSIWTGISDAKWLSDEKRRCWPYNLRPRRGTRPRNACSTPSRAARSMRCALSISP